LELFCCKSYFEFSARDNSAASLDTAAMMLIWKHGDLFVVYLAMLPVAETASTLSDRAVNEY
jgi:hypothetical protein